MNIVSIYKTLARKSTQTFSADHRNLLLTVNQKQPTDIKNVTLFAKLFFYNRKSNVNEPSQPLGLLTFYPVLKMLHQCNILILRRILRKYIIMLNTYSYLYNPVNP